MASTKYWTTAVEMPDYMYNVTDHARAVLVGNNEDLHWPYLHDEIVYVFQAELKIALEKNDTARIDQLKKAYAYLHNPGRMAHDVLTNEKHATLLPSLNCFIYPEIREDLDPFYDVDEDDRDEFFRDLIRKDTRTPGTIAAIALASFLMIPYAVFALCVTPVIALVSFAEFIMGVIPLPKESLLDKAANVSSSLFANVRDGSMSVAERVQFTLTALARTVFSPFVSLYAMVVNVPAVFKTFALRIVETDVFHNAFCQPSDKLKPIEPPKKLSSQAGILPSLQNDPERNPAVVSTVVLNQNQSGTKSSATSYKSDEYSYTNPTNGAVFNTVALTGTEKLVFVGENGEPVLNYDPFADSTRSKQSLSNQDGNESDYLSSPSSSPKHSQLFSSSPSSSPKHSQSFSGSNRNPLDFQFDVSDEEDRDEDKNDQGMEVHRRSLS